ncbi:hypothetical protein TVNIR_2890 [Thioalkalivibrio nitratireducens DSM 14787]|uniref:Uncharacterized protein n=1 Tax=Thioalkalivibrio nitratireducens (strain DSM 14787 / UNIQEM 213 / ALEN2) TaxID=1255043 RepID=L0DZQ1_THIND|nr:hypothetical protein TVNIR_2890 [Thioalkalivibrio nitratireducens DSM 14787]
MVQIRTTAAAIIRPVLTDAIALRMQQFHDAVRPRRTHKQHMRT